MASAIDKTVYVTTLDAVKCTMPTAQSPVLDVIWLNLDFYVGSVDNHIYHLRIVPLGQNIMVATVGKIDTNAGWIRGLAACGEHIVC
jgi:hypothetical protein